MVTRCENTTTISQVSCRAVVRPLGVLYRARHVRSSGSESVLSELGCVFIVALVSRNALLASSFLGSHEHSVPPPMHRGYVPCGHYPGGAALFSPAIPASNPPSSVSFLQEQRVDANVQKPIRDGGETSLGVPRPEATRGAGRSTAESRAHRCG